MLHMGFFGGWDVDSIDPVNPVYPVDPMDLIDPVSPWKISISVMNKV